LIDRPRGRLPAFKPENQIMKKLPLRGLAAAAALCGAICPRAVMAHGFEGDRFFPPTIATDDPFAVDELSVPTIQIFRNPPSPGGMTTRETDFGGEFDKELLPGWDLEFSDVFTALQPKGGPTTDGWQNFDLGSKLELIQNPDHEFILSIGADWDIGGTGGKSIGVDSFSTITPTVFFGKGFGDLPDSASMWKPFAITGEVGNSFPFEASDPNSFQLGLALEYSLLYLEQDVKDTGMPDPFRNMIPVVEFVLNSPENRGGGVSTGTVNPGVLWETRFFQFGAEAVIPINSHSGPNVGFLFNVNIFFDDMWPKVFGHPLFGGGETMAETTPGGSGK
jgi:hypothetical protein